MLSGYKTYITAAVAVITAISLYLVGDANIATTAQSVFAALMVIFLRNGVAKL